MSSLDRYIQLSVVCHLDYICIISNDVTVSLYVVADCTCQLTSKMLLLKSDTVAVLAALPRYPLYYSGNGYKFYSITVVLGLKYTGLHGDGDQACSTTAVKGLGFSRVHVIL